MRPLIIKDKFIGKEKIESYQDFVLEDKYFIKEEKEGFIVEGKITLKGQINYLETNEIVNKDIDLNILIPYDKLESRNMIKLVLDKVDYSINDNILIIKIKVKVVGEENIKENFFIKEERKIEFPPQTKIINENNNDEFIKSMEKMFENQEIEMVSTIDNDKNVDILDVRIEKEDEITEPLPLVKEEIQEKEELLKTEYVTTFFFYRVKENEELNDILNKYNMSYDEFKKLNNKIDVKKNDLIQIKIK